MLETLILLALCTIDAILIMGAIFFGWRPFANVLRSIWKRALRFCAVLSGTALGLTITIPWVDQILYMQGHTLGDDFMISFAPAFIIIVSLTSAIAVVWELDRKK